MGCRRRASQIASTAITGASSHSGTGQRKGYAMDSSRSYTARRRQVKVIRKHRRRNIRRKSEEANTNRTVTFRDPLSSDEDEYEIFEQVRLSSVYEYGCI